MATYINNTTIKIEGTTVALQITLGGSTSYTVPAGKLFKGSGLCVSKYNSGFDLAYITVNGIKVLESDSLESLGANKTTKAIGTIEAGPGAVIVLNGGGAGIGNTNIATLVGALYQNTP
jgi:hypothetical protein